VLGFIVELAKGRIYMPEAKIACTQALCSPDKRQASQTMTRREPAYPLIGRPTSPAAWKEPVQLSQVVVKDLLWIGSNLRNLHAAP
jgi:hypothetical protein